jgi:hypothetical protein
VIEDDSAVDGQQPDRGTRRVGRMRCWVTVEQLGGLVGQVAHQTAGERRQIGEPRPAHGAGRGDQRSAGFELRTDVERKLAHDVAQLEAAAGQHEGGRRIAGHEGIASPTLGPFDGFEQDPGPATGDGGEQPHGRGDIGEQLRPDRDEGPLASERVEDLPFGSDPKFERHGRLLTRTSPGHVPGARRGSVGVPSRAEARGSSSPPATPTSSPGIPSSAIVASRLLWSQRRLLACATPSGGRAPLPSLGGSVDAPSRPGLAFRRSRRRPRFSRLARGAAACRLGAS